MSTADRHLEWAGCFNVRDLGGLPVAGGRQVAHGALVRADSLSRLTAEGWQALLDHGVRTVVDLRNEQERAGGDDAPRPPEIETVEVPLDGSEDRTFWEPIEANPEFGTPLYYRAHLLRKPQMSAAAVAAVARAKPGGVAFHCVAGRDRSGMLAMVLLALLGVPVEEIGADYEVTRARLAVFFERAGRADEGAELLAWLAERGTTPREVIAATLSSLDLEATLRGAGLTEEDLNALRERALEPQ